VAAISAALVGHLLGRRRWPFPLAALADRVVDLLDLREERIEALRVSVAGAPEREVAAGPQQSGRDDESGTDPDWTFGQ
jgi:hypothetical protein